MRRKSWRVIVSPEEGQLLPPIHYASRQTALKGAVWHADHHPHAHVRVQRYDPVAGRYVGYTETRGTAER